LEDAGGVTKLARESIRLPPAVSRKQKTASLPLRNLVEDCPPPIPTNKIVLHLTPQEGVSFFGVDGRWPQRLTVENLKVGPISTGDLVRIGSDRS
jgi:hypothetical protein